MSQVVINRLGKLERRMDELFADAPEDDALARRIAALEARVALIEQTYAKKPGRKANDGTD